MSGLDGLTCIMEYISSFENRMPSLKWKSLDLRGNVPLTAKHPTKTVMSILSAMGSTTLPTTVCSFQRRAIHPSIKSVIPAYAKSPTAHACWSWRMRYPIAGAAIRREKVRALGTVYMFSCGFRRGNRSLTLSRRVLPAPVCGL